METPEGPRTRVLVVAARRDMIDRLLSAVRRAGLRPEGIDLSAFAMIRALHHPAGDRRRRAWCSTSPPAASPTSPSPTGRAASSPASPPTASRGWSTQLAERRELTVDHARQWLSHVGLTTPVDEVDGDPQIVGEARTVLNEGAREIADDVRNSLEFYGAQSDGRPVERAILTGPGASIPGFGDELARPLGLPVEAAAVVEARPGAIGGLDGATLQRRRRPGDRGGPGMRAVNLVPTEERSGGGRTGIAVYIFLGVLRAVAVGLAALVLTNNQIDHRRAKLTEAQVKATAAEAEAKALKPYADFAALREKRVQTVDSLAKSRFDWPRVLDDLSRAMPRSAWVQTFTGTVSPGVSAAGGGGGHRPARRDRRSRRGAQRLRDQPDRGRPDDDSPAPDQGRHPRQPGLVGEGRHVGKRQRRR